MVLTATTMKLKIYSTLPWTGDISAWISSLAMDIVTSSLAILVKVRKGEVAASFMIVFRSWRARGNDCWSTTIYFFWSWKWMKMIHYQVVFHYAYERKIPVTVTLSAILRLQLKHEIWSTNNHWSLFFLLARTTTTVSSGNHKLRSIHLVRESLWTLGSNSVANDY